MWYIYIYVVLNSSLCNFLYVNLLFSSSCRNDLLHYVELVPTISTQLRIVSSVKAVTTEDETVSMGVISFLKNLWVSWYHGRDTRFFFISNLIFLVSIGVAYFCAKFQYWSCLGSCLIFDLTNFKFWSILALKPLNCWLYSPFPLIPKVSSSPKMLRKRQYF